MATDSTTRMSNQELQEKLWALFGRVREPELTKETTALLCIDLQYVDAHPECGLGAKAKALDIPDFLGYYWVQLEDVVIPNERLSPNEKGIIHGATGLAGWKPMVDLSPLIAEAERRGVFSVGVGDFGNELGFGRIHGAVKEIQPFGKRC